MGIKKELMGYIEIVCELFLEKKIEMMVEIMNNKVLIKILISFYFGGKIG